MDSTNANDNIGGGMNVEELDHALRVEMASTDGSDLGSEDHIAPLLTQPEKPPLNIFSVSYPKRKTNKDQISRLIEPEPSPFNQFIMWSWSGSRYSGLVCMALSSSIYCFMGIMSDVFSAQAIPLFEIAFARCIIISALSFIWLRRTTQPIFGPPNVRSLFLLRAITGCISLITFIYSIQRLPFSLAMLLSFTTPLMASISAKFILHEDFTLSEIAAIVSSFFGAIFIIRSTVSVQGTEEGQQVHGIHYFYVFLIGVLSSLSGGMSYCFIRAGANQSDQPVVTIFSFGLLSCPAAAICMITFDDFVVPSFHSFILMVILAILAFIAELFLARGLQLEKTSKVANIQYIEVALSQLLGLVTSRLTPSFGGIVGFFIIFISTSCTMYLGPEKDME